MNLVLPGSGTILSAFSFLHVKDQKYVHLDRKCNFSVVLDGVMQFLLAIIAVGWIWSGCYGYSIFVKSLDVPSPPPPK